MNAAEDLQTIDEEGCLFEGELCPYFPPSPLFALKKAFPIMCFLAIPIAIMAFGNQTALSSFENMRNALGVPRFAIYYVCCTIMALYAGYWVLYVRSFRFGVAEGMFYIRKGVVVKQSFDYPVTSIENVGVRRDVLDALFGISTVQLFTAHEESDDLAAIQGIPVSMSDDLHKFIRALLAEYQASRLDIQALKSAVKDVRSQ